MNSKHSLLAGAARADLMPLAATRIAGDLRCALAAVMLHVVQNHAAPSLGHTMVSEECNLIPEEYSWLRSGDDLLVETRSRGARDDCRRDGPDAGGAVRVRLLLFRVSQLPQ